MFYSISLYIALAIFIGGLIYKIAAWLSYKVGVDAKEIPTSKRFSSAVKGILVTIFSANILTLLKIGVLDVLLQRKVLKEDTFRWVTPHPYLWSIHAFAFHACTGCIHHLSGIFQLLGHP